MLISACVLIIKLNMVTSFDVLCCRYMSFPEEGKLWSEVHSLLEALQNDQGDAKNHLLTGNHTGNTVIFLKF